MKYKKKNNVVFLKKKTKKNVVEKTSYFVYISFSE